MPFAPLLPPPDIRRTARRFLAASRRFEVAAQAPSNSAPVPRGIVKRLAGLEPVTERSNSQDVAGNEAEGLLYLADLVLEVTVQLIPWRAEVTLVSVCACKQDGLHMGQLTLEGGGQAAKQMLSSATVKETCAVAHRVISDPTYISCALRAKGGQCSYVWCMQQR